MGPHEELLRDVVDRFGALRSVSIAHEVLKQPEEYELAFDAGVLLVGVNSDDDTLQLTRGASVLGQSLRVDVSTWDPWDRVIGTSAIWAWELRNQQGRWDALQIEFSLKPGFAAIQLVCQASAIDTRKVEPVETLRLPWKRG